MRNFAVQMILTDNQSKGIRTTGSLDGFYMNNMQSGDNPFIVLHVSIVSLMGLSFQVGAQLIMRHLGGTSYTTYIHIDLREAEKCFLFPKDKSVYLWVLRVYTNFGVIFNYLWFGPGERDQWCQLQCSINSQ